MVYTHVLVNQTAMNFPECIAPFYFMACYIPRESAYRPFAIVSWHVKKTPVALLPVVSLKVNSLALPSVAYECLRTHLTYAEDKQS